MKLLWILLLAIGCNGGALETTQTANKDFQVEFLFEFEGCKVYRFSDDRVVHYTNCSGSVSSYVSCGGGCRREATVTTRTNRCQVLSDDPNCKGPK